MTLTPTKRSPRRALAKAITYRIYSTGITTGCTWLVTGRAAVAVSVGVVDVVVKIATYYLHERVWDRLDSGQIRLPLAESWIPRRRIANALEYLRSRGR